MNTPLDNQRNRNLPDDRLFDRLVDGELPDAERRLLLQRLEAEPDGWRRCALAFLEAQAWRQSLGPMAASLGTLVEPASPTLPSATVSFRKTRIMRLVASACALVACMAIAFALGWELHPKPAVVATGVMVAKVDSAAIGTGSPEATKPDAVASAAQRPSSPGQKVPAPLDVLLKKWEQQGYRAERQDRVVPVELKDGRKVNVPVQEYRLQYMGGRTY
jgi:hypothetical protein